MDKKKFVKCVNMQKKGVRNMKKCDNCNMPKFIKAKNTSIKNGTGLCSMCYQAKEQKYTDESFEMELEMELRQDAEREDANEMLKEMRDGRDEL